MEIEAEDDQLQVLHRWSPIRRCFEVIHPPTPSPSASNQLTRLRLAALSLSRAPSSRRFGTFLLVFLLAGDDKLCFANQVEEGRPRARRGHAGGLNERAGREHDVTHSFSPASEALIRCGL